jgi:heme/copper-type cytochrome/quinol oxidase subunit 3
MATRLFLLSLAILFGASLIGVLVVRMRAAEWPPPGSPALPSGLWSATGVLALISAVLGLAARAARSGSTVRLRNLLTAATALGVAFVIGQTVNWAGIAAAGFTPRQSLFVFVLYVLTFLHAVHVVAGLVPLALVTLRSGVGRYVTDDEPVELVASYGHFLGVAWIAIFVVLLI